MKYRLLFSLLLTTILSHAQKLNSFRPDRSLSTLADSSLTLATRNYLYLQSQLPPDRFPVAYDPARRTMKTSGSEPWVSGFYPGTLLYLYEATHDQALYEEAKRKMVVLEKEKFNKTTHDLGFMMYCSFGNADRLEASSAYKEVIVTSARSLASRFSEKVGAIRSWDSKPSQFMVIIDNMMNLELLFAATRLTGDSSFYKIAVTHANTTMEHHFRPDHSSWHLVIYDPATGAVQKKQTVQGAADSSAWARGQSWGLYGYTLMYRATRQRKYLEQAELIADYMLKHLPTDGVFYWDFQAPGIPDTWRDASAAAITCSALIELAGYTKKKTGRKYFRTAEKILAALSSPAYLATPDEAGGFILKHGVGNRPANSDIDVSLIYADYYYVEALMRYRRRSNN